MPQEQKAAWIFDSLESKDNLHIFGKYILPEMIRGDYEVPQCHLDLLEEIARRETSAIIFPRGFAKSTWEKVDTIHDIVYRLEDVIVYISATIGDAAQHFDAIKAQLESNDLIHDIYGNLVPDEKAPGRKWTSRHFQTTNGVNVVARGRSKGRGINIKNRRPTKVIVDDAEDDETVKKPEQRLKFHDWLYNVIFPSLDKEKGYIKMIGTTLHAQCELLAFYEAHGGIFRRAIEDGKSIWPEYWSLEELLRKRDGYTRPDGTHVKGIGTRAFNREYMNNTASDDEAIIKRVWIERSTYTILPADSPYDGYLYLDPQAGKTSRADEYALTCLFNKRQTNHRYVIEQEADRKSQPDQARAVVRMWLKYKAVIRYVGIEVVLNQTAVWQTLLDWKARKIDFNTKEMKEGDPDWIDESDRNIPIIEWSPEGKDKEARLQMFEADFERGEIHLQPSMTDLRDQLMFLDESSTGHDDRADSLVGALEIVGRKGFIRPKPESLRNTSQKRYTGTIAGNLRNKRW